MHNHRSPVVDGHMEAYMQPPPRHINLPGLVRATGYPNRRHGGRRLHLLIHSTPQCRPPSSVAPALQCDSARSPAPLSRPGLRAPCGGLRTFVPRCHWQWRQLRLSGAQPHCQWQAERHGAATVAGASPARAGRARAALGSRGALGLCAVAPWRQRPGQHPPRQPERQL